LQVEEKDIEIDNEDEENEIPEIIIEIPMPDF
jgi:hypothetical protein